MQRLLKHRQAVRAEVRAKLRNGFSAGAIDKLKSDIAWIRKQYILDRGCLFDNETQAYLEAAQPVFEKVMRYWGIEYKISQPCRSLLEIEFKG